ncbi:transcriptional regulator PchE [Enterobacterales bacterium]|nr:transcriptional regulator PchE [Enterobacterales bacterium]
MIKDDKAEALEKAGLYRRAASRWLEVFDLRQMETEREWLTRRRNECIRNASDPDATRTRQRKEYKAMVRYNAGI